MLHRTLPDGFIAPCVPTKTDRLPSGKLWLHKISGFRVIARKDGPRVRLYSRPGNDLTRRFKLGLLEGIVSKRLARPTVPAGRGTVVKSKNALQPAVKREEEEDWGK